MREKAKGSEPIAERDDDGALLREPRAVVAFLAAEAREEPAAVDPYHHWAPRRVCVQRARPDVEIEAVLRDASGERIDVAVRLVLHAVVTELTCGAHTGPVRRRLRRPPTQLADRRCGVGNTAKHNDPARGIHDSFNGAGVDGDAWWGGDARGVKAGEDCGYDRSGPHHQKRFSRHLQRCRSRRLDGKIG